MPPLIVYVDERLLARAVENLLGNAIQYNRDGGLVRVTGAAEEPAAGEWVSGRVTVRISDAGVGVPRAEWERIFDRFQRLDSSRSRRTGGSGLGLAICRAVVGIYGGTVHVAESSNAGTTSELQLPGAPVSPEAAPV